METCYQNQGYSNYNNYNGTSNTGYQQQPMQNAKRNQFAVEQYNANSQVSQNQSGQQQPEQPPMPPEAEAALDQLKNMPCPMTYFPPNMMNNPMGAGSSMFQQGNMGGGFSNFQNPHSANNTQLHAQNFQLHQELHGMGNQSRQGDFQSGLSNAQRQHALNPDLHAQNFQMHQNLHGVGKPGNQGPKHAQAAKPGTATEGRTNNYQSSSNQQQMLQSQQTNYNNQYSHNTNPNMSNTQYNMPQYSMAGQQSPMAAQQTPCQHSTCQNPSCQHSKNPQSAYSVDQSMYPAYQAVNSQSPQYYGGQRATGQNYTSNSSMDSSSMGQYAMGQNPTDSQYSYGQQHATCQHAHQQLTQPFMGQQSVTPHPTGQDLTNNQYMNTHYPTQQYTDSNSMGQTAAYNYSSSQAHSRTHANETNQTSKPHYIAPYYTETHETETKSHHHSPHKTTENDFMHSDEPRYPTIIDEMYPVYRKDDSRQVQELICPGHEPHLSVVRRSDGSHELLEPKGNAMGSSGEGHLTNPWGYQNTNSAPQAKHHGSLLDIGSQAHHEKNNGLQGIRSSPAFSPKTWVIGPPSRKTKGYM